MESDKIFDALPFAVMSHNTKRIISLFNTEAERITGYSRNEVIGKDCHEVFPGGFCGKKCSFREGVVIKNFDCLHYPLEFTNKKGYKFLLDMRVKPISDSSGNISGVVATFQDAEGEIQLEKEIGKTKDFCGIVGKNEKMQRVFQQILNVSKVSFPVLLLGESGTGKELTAEAIHQLSPRKNGPFVTVNCGAIPDTLIESELFGYVKGAFTGASKDKKGRFEMAHGGTIFLDEIGDISPMMQLKLLRIVQTGIIEKLGDTTLSRVDVRIISATNKDLKEEIQKGRFREDLFYRISVIPIELPPLRERKDDIPLLVDHFLKSFSKSFGLKRFTLSNTAMDVLLSHSWPGNIRELQNVLQYALVQANEGTNRTVDLRHLPTSIMRQYSTELKTEAKPKKNRKLSKESVKEALDKCNGNKVKAAKELGVSRATLYRFLSKIKKL